MKESNNEQIKRIDFENILIAIFIIAGLLNIYANKLRQEYLKTNNKQKDDFAHEIYVFIITVSIFAYSYFVNRNYKAYKEDNGTNQNNYQSKMNFIGSVFLFVGAIFILLGELNDSDEERPFLF